MKLEVVTGISKNFFQPNLRKKFGLDAYNPTRDRMRPLLMFGCGSTKLKTIVMQHTGFCLIIWTGSDSLRLHNFPEFVDFCKRNTSRIFHITRSHWVRLDLDHWGIPHIQKLITPTDLTKVKFEPETQSKIYHYGSKKKVWYYGTPLVKGIEYRWANDSTKPKFLFATPGEYTPDKLYQIYKDSLLGIRLTEHDGIAGSVIEMGLMGRRTIYNGEYPCSVPYSKNDYRQYTPAVLNGWVHQNGSLVEKVVKLITDEFEKHPIPDKLLAEEMKEYVYDDLKWLDTKFYG